MSHTRPELAGYSGYSDPARRSPRLKRDLALPVGRGPTVEHQGKCGWPSDRLRRPLWPSRARLTLGPPNRTYNAATAAIGPLGATPHSWRPTIGRRPILDSAIARERTQRIGPTASLVGKNNKNNILIITTSPLLPNVCGFVNMSAVRPVRNSLRRPQNFSG